MKMVELLKINNKKNLHFRKQYWNTKKNYLLTVQNEKKYHTSKTNKGSDKFVCTLSSLR